MTAILVVGPHPDDQELGMGGTIARLAEAGHHVTLLDMTNGEPTPHGDPETRAKEAARAAEILGVRRVGIDLPNRRIELSLDARHRVAGVIRTERAEIVFAPCMPDAHPDHVATTAIVEAARFDAKLTQIDLPGIRSIRAGSSTTTARTCAGSPTRASSWTSPGARIGRSSRFSPTTPSSCSPSRTVGSSSGSAPRAAISAAGSARPRRSPSTRRSRSACGVSRSWCLNSDRAP